MMVFTINQCTLAGRNAAINLRQHGRIKRGATGRKTGYERKAGYQATEHSGAPYRVEMVTSLLSNAKDGAVMG